VVDHETAFKAMFETSGSFKIDMNIKHIQHENYLSDTVK
jgi:hypothetical protein